MSALAVAATARTRSSTKRTSVASSVKQSAAKATSLRKSKQLSMREAALTVFAANRNKALALAELYTAMCKLSGYKASKAPTPHATLGAALYTRPEMFEKVEPGVFRANPGYLKKWKAQS